MSSNLQQSSNPPPITSQLAGNIQHKKSDSTGSTGKVDVCELLDHDPLARKINTDIAPEKQLSMTQQEQLRTYIEDKNACATGSGKSK